MFTPELERAAAELLAVCRAKGWKIATAESCTGGLLSSLLTGVPGSSDVFTCGFVTYSYESKTAMLGVDADMLAREGAVSEPVARAMAQGALLRASADLALAITGIAGPGGGMPHKPVGLVYIAVATREKTTLEKHVFSGDRAEVRLQSVKRAMALLCACAA